jgi:hypothetical protein
MSFGRTIVMGALLLGAVGGYASGFRSVACWKHRREVERHQALQMLARTCAEAAVAAQGSRVAPNPPQSTVPR